MSSKKTLKASEQEREDIAKSRDEWRKFQKTVDAHRLIFLDESGLKNFQVTIWHGLYAPKGTPAAVQQKLNTALKAALKDPEFIKKQEGLGAVVVTDKRVEPAEHKKFVQSEVARFGPVIKAAGAYAD